MVPPVLTGPEGKEKKQGGGLKTEGVGNGQLLGVRAGVVAGIQVYYIVR